MNAFSSVPPKPHSTALRTLSIYGDLPWLFDPAPEGIAELFADARTERLPARKIVPFGSTHEVFWVESGLFATYAGFRGEFRLMTGLFGPQSILGGIKALTHPGGHMELRLRTLSDTVVRAIDAVRFRNRLNEHPALRDAVLLYFLAMHERQIDGLLISQYLPLPERLALLIDTIRHALGVPESAKPTIFPIPLLASDLADMLHAERASVSRILSRWAKMKLFHREGRSTMAFAGPLGECLEDSSERTKSVVL